MGNLGWRTGICWFSDTAGMRPAARKSVNSFNYSMKIGAFAATRDDGMAGELQPDSGASILFMDEVALRARQ